MDMEVPETFYHFNIGLLVQICIILIRNTSIAGQELLEPRIPHRRLRCISKIYIRPTKETIEDRIGLDFSQGTKLLTGAAKPLILLHTSRAESRV